jgi:hypothetical protein
MTARDAGRMQRRRLTLAAGAALVVAAACNDVPSDPKTPFSIEFAHAPSPSVVLGDTLFDSLGVAAPLRARVFNSNGDEIVGANVTYHVVAYDTNKVPRSNPAYRDSVPLTVDSISGFVFGKANPVFAGKHARVYAQAGKLQSDTVGIVAVRRADTVIAAGTVTDTLSFLNPDSLPLSPALTATVRHTSDGAVAAADSAVPSYLVWFRIVQPAGGDTSFVVTVNGNRKPSQIDTTDATGTASRQVRIRRASFPFTKAADSTGFISDTVIVEVAAYRAYGAAVPGSGSRILLVIKSRKP